jgi:uncharacterized protein (TIGR02117 family)
MRRVLKIVLLLFIPILFYIFLSFLLLLLPTKSHCTKGTKTIYIYADAAHTEIMIPVKYFEKLYKKEFPNLLKNQNYGFLAFSYGDEEFMMKVPSWDDIDYKIALKSLFTNTPALIRVGHYYGIDKENSVKVSLSSECLENLNKSILNSFAKNDDHNVRFYDHYKHPKVFYFQAKRSYNLFHTCNSWTGDRLREAGLKASYLTPFAQQVVYPYKKD